MGVGGYGVMLNSVYVVSFFVSVVSFFVSLFEFAIILSTKRGPISLRSYYVHVSKDQN